MNGERMKGLNARPLNELRRQIRAGAGVAHCKHLSDGCYRAAYTTDTGLIVKKDGTDSNHRLNPCLADFPVRRAPTVRVQAPDGTVYHIQRLYTRLLDTTEAEQSPHSDTLTKAEKMPHYDLHQGNLGLDKRGRLVAFDY